jgi:DNA-binding response OmpR family regulator
MPQQAQQPLVRPKRILLVDDDVGYGEMLNRYAALVGVHLDAIHSGAVGAALRAIDYYDVVLLNYDLESFTGLEVAEFLGQANPQIPVVMVASSSNPWEAEHGGTPGVRAVVNKWDGLANLLKAALSV